MSLVVANDQRLENITNTIKKKISEKGNYTFELQGNSLNPFYSIQFDLLEGKKNGFVQISRIDYYTSDLVASNLDFNKKSCILEKGEKTQNIPVLKAEGAEIQGKTFEWISSNSNVASVSEDGTITAVGRGKANIRAIFKGDDTYAPSSASFDVKVMDTPQLKFSEQSLTIVKGDKFTLPTLLGLPSEIGVTYQSSNPEVATIDEKSGNVTINGVGKTTINASTQESEYYHATKASYDLIVKLGKESSTTIFDFTSDDYYENVPSSGYVSLSKIEQGGILLKFKANAESKIEPSWYKSNRTIHLYSKDTLTIASNYNIKQIEFDFFDEKHAAENSDIKVSSQGNYKYVNTALTGKFIISSNEKVKSLSCVLGKTVYIKRITVKTDMPDGTIEVATKEGYGTYYSPLSYVMPEGLVGFGYTGIDLSKNSLTKSEDYVAGDIVPAETALVVKGKQGKYGYQITDAKANKIIENNLLKGVSEKTTINVESNLSRYILTYGTSNNVLGFFRTKSGYITVQANRAYLEIPGMQAIAGFSFDDQTTGVDALLQKEVNKNMSVYTLSGVKIRVSSTQELPAGLYIINSKLVKVK